MFGSTCNSLLPWAGTSCCMGLPDTRIAVQANGLQALSLTTSRTIGAVRRVIEVAGTKGRMLTKAHLSEHHFHYPPMMSVDRLQRYLSQPSTPNTMDGYQNCRARHVGGTGNVNVQGKTSVVGEETIVLANWQVLFASSPPDPSEFNLVFNNHNLIDDDKLSLLSPPQSPERLPGFEAPSSPRTVSTFVDDRDYRSPTDTHSSGEIEIIRVTPHVYKHQKSASLGRRGHSAAMSSNLYPSHGRQVRDRRVRTIPEEFSPVQLTPDKPRKRNRTRRMSPVRQQRLVDYGMV